MGAQLFSMFLDDLANVCLHGTNCALPCFAAWLSFCVGGFTRIPAFLLQQQVGPAHGIHYQHLRWHGAACMVVVLRVVRSILEAQKELCVTFWCAFPRLVLAGAACRLVGVSSFFPSAARLPVEGPCEPFAQGTGCHPCPTVRGPCEPFAQGGEPLPIELEETRRPACIHHMLFFP